MLQRIRDKSSGPLAYVVVGLIVLVFSVWGLGSYFTGSANPAVAQVGDVKITKYQLRRAYNQRYRRLQQLLGDNFDADKFKQDKFRRAVLESLIQKQLLKQYAQDAGYRVPDAAVLAALQRDKRFQVNGSFSTKRYHAVLSRAGIAAAAFEEHIRNKKQVAQIRRGILRTAVVSDAAVKRAFALANQERRIAYLAFLPQDFVDQVEVTDDEIKAYYNSHPDKFMRKQRVKIAYVMLDRSELKVTSEPTKKDLKELYQQVKAERFKTPERRKARQILIQIDSDTSAAEAREKIQALASKLEQGNVSFAELARKVSDDQASAAKGGMLGWITRKSSVRGFADTLFKLEKGEISNPVKTEFGWHLLKLVKIDSAEVEPFSDPQVQSELESLYRKRARKDRYENMANRLESLAFQTTTLEPIADKLGLAIHKTGWVTRSEGNGIAAHKAVRNAVFSPAVLKDHLNSTPIRLGGHRQVVVRVAARKPAHRRPLEKVRDKIREHLVHQEAIRLAREKAKSLVQALRADKKQFKAIAQSGPAKLVQVGWIGRDDSDIPTAFQRTAFALPKPSDGEKATYGSASTGSGTTAVLRLTGVRMPDTEATESMQRIRRRLRSRIAGMEYRALRRSLRNQYDVTIYEDRLP